ncbi:MAG: signal peptide peptidase SppA [Candidatus Binatia bacterium]
MLRRAWRHGLAASSLVLEALLRALGRRPPYGILKVDLAGELAEEPVEHRLLAMLQPHRDDYFNLIVLLRWAREDPQLRGVFVRCENLRGGWAKIQEIRRSLMALRQAGKAVWVHLTHPGIREYVLASAADQIILTPAGTLDVAGLSSEVTFVAGALKKLGIQAELVQMGKYKSAAETFTRSDMSEPHREMVESLIQDLYEQVVDAIAEGRGMGGEAVRHLLDRGPFMAREAAQEHLVDALLYDDEAEARMRARCDDQAVIERSAYFSRRARAARREMLRHGRPAIGLLHVTGSIKTGENISGTGAASACGAAAVARDLKALRERRDIGAVVIRISSPGGSGLASDLIWHEVMRTRKQKPVVVSFGDVAASGGYYVGVAGNPVLAEAGTITGSIGVLAGKALLKGLYDQLGITKQVITRGRHAALYSDYVPLGEEERQRLQTEAEFFYADFIDKVASGRQLSAGAVAAAAEGRVWSGRQAKEIGLVDQLGGIEEALDEAKVLAGLTPDVRVSVERYPRPRRLWKLSMNLAPPQSRLHALHPWVRFITSERLWAILPFNFRFF